MEFKKLLFSSNGRMGIGPTSFGVLKRSEVIARDEIHVAFGSNMPLILRPLLPQGEAALRKSYILIGTCYIHRIMDGEALDKSSGGEEILLC
jgi:hypothetical protein